MKDGIREAIVTQVYLAVAYATFSTSEPRSSSRCIWDSKEYSALSQQLNSGQDFGRFQTNIPAGNSAVAPGI
jgi:hypothetical protein